MRLIERRNSQNSLRVVLFLSEMGTGLRYLLEENPRRGLLYEFVGAITTARESESVPLLEAAGIPWVCHDIRRFYERQGSPLTDMELRKEFDARTLELITGYSPDIIALYGYRYILTDPVLRAYPRRIINVHHADLLVTDGDARPRYRGLRAVRDAVMAGDALTRSSVHLVTKEVDAGPILVRSQPFPVHRGLVEPARRWGATDILKAYAYAHGQWMIRETWGPLLDTALRLLAEGRVTLAGDGRVSIDGRPGPYEMGDEVHFPADWQASLRSQEIGG